MPRICDSADNPHDFCRTCMPTEDEAEEEFGDVGDGPDGRGNCFAYKPEHPPYEGDYVCEHCEEELTEVDE